MATVAVGRPLRAASSPSTWASCEPERSTGCSATSPATHRARSAGPNGISRSTVSRPLGSPSAGWSTPIQAGSRTMSKPGWTACQRRARPASSRRCTSTPRWSSLRRFSRRELVIRRPSDSLSIHGVPGRQTVRTELVGCQGSPCWPRSVSRPWSSSSATAGRSVSSRACQGCSGSAAVPGGSGRPYSSAVIRSAGVPVPESAASRPRSTAHQCSRNEPCSSGEYAADWAGPRPSRLFGVGCSGWPSSSDCSARRNGSAGAAVSDRRWARISAVRPTESATREVRSASWPGSGRPVAPATRAATVTASTGCSAAPVERVAGPNRCQPQADQCRTGAVSRAVPPSTGMRSRSPSGRAAAVSRAQQRNRLSAAACSAAIAGSGWSSRSGVGCPADDGRGAGMTSVRMVAKSAP